uniref:Uncharacterized protein n=1 Tax=Ackermannviridae sp. TaxID=2831612 RepID=A0A8S5RTY2_9CAUD|nr:MAG TPA: hypothetical protein [Ackermannviridae sp.]
MTAMLHCRLDFNVDKKRFYILPSISILRDNPVYAERNFAIQFDWLAAHARVMFVKAGWIV